jgi:hypothetical protein
VAARSTTLTTWRTTDRRLFYLFRSSPCASWTLLCFIIDFFDCYVLKNGLVSLCNIH